MHLTTGFFHLVYRFTTRLAARAPRMKALDRYAHICLANAAVLRRTVGVLIRTVLPGTMRGNKVDSGARALLKLRMLYHLASLIVRHGQPRGPVTSFSLSQKPNAAAVAVSYLALG